jgi:hypothetical protein
MKLIMIDWLDSHASKGWQTLEDLELADQPLKCRSVGWLFKETKESKTIIPHLADKNNNMAPQGCGDFTIPTRAILKVTVLRNK